MPPAGEPKVEAPRRSAPQYRPIAVVLNGIDRHMNDEKIQVLVTSSGQLRELVKGDLARAAGFREFKR